MTFLHPPRQRGPRAWRPARAFAIAVLLLFVAPQALSAASGASEGAAALVPDADHESDYHESGYHTHPDDFVLDGGLPPAIPPSAIAEWAVIPIQREHVDGSLSPAFYAIHLPSLGLTLETLVAAGLPAVPLAARHATSPEEFSALALAADDAKAAVDALVAEASPLEPGDVLPQPQQTASVGPSDPVGIAVYYDYALMTAAGTGPGAADSAWTAGVDLMSTSGGVSISRVVLVQATSTTPIPANVADWCDMVRVANYEETVRSGVKGHAVAIFSPGMVELQGGSTASGLMQDGPITKRLSQGESRTGSGCTFGTRTPAFLPQTYVRVDFETSYVIPTQEATLASYWTAHELGHVFSMQHSYASCWSDWYTFGMHVHKTVEAATSASDTPSSCGSYDEGHYHWAFSSSGKSHMQSERARWGDCMNAGWCTSSATPASPTVVATRGDRQVELRVDTAPPNGGSTITRYAVYRSTSDNFQSTSPIGYITGSTGTYTDTGRTNGVTYYYYLRAENVYGLGPRSAYVSATPAAATVPGAPTLNSATGGAGYVDLAWSPPSSNGGSAITSYNVYRATCSNCQGSTPYASGISASATTWRDTGVADGTTYYYKVAAVNAVGTGPLSSQRSATTHNVPGAPTLNSATGGSGYVDLSWSPPSSNGGSAITSYNVYRATCSNCQGSTPYASGISASATTWRDTGVASSTTYYYKVAAVNAVGTSAMSNQRSATTGSSGPANDNIGNAFVGSGTSWTPSSQSTAGATVQTNEVRPCNMGTATVWYKFTPSSTGTYRFSTSGSSYDTVLAIYNSGTLGSTQLACNDDSGGSLTSQLDHTLTSGVSYWAQIGQYSTSTPGTLQLSIARQTANTAPTSCFSTSVSGMVVTVDTGCSSDPDGNALTYTVHWGDGTSSSGSVTSTDDTRSHEYAARGWGTASTSHIGAYAIQVVVSDGSATGSSTTTRDVGPTDAQLALYWAPILYGDTAYYHSTGGGTIEEDEIVAFDFDGDWTGLNNWANANGGNHDAYVYYHVSETETDYYIGYAVFHARDFDSVWGGSGDEGEHENDMETVLIMVHKDGTQYGEFVATLTMAHNYVNAYKQHFNDGSASYNLQYLSAAGAGDAFSGDVDFETDSYGMHVKLDIEHGGHGIYAHPKVVNEASNPDLPIWDDATNDFRGGDGNIYKPRTWAETPGEGTGGPRGDDTYVPYQLVPINTMWGKRYDYGSTQPFNHYGAFNGDDGTPDDAAHAPWAIYNSANGESRSDTLWFENPAVVFLDYFYNFPESPSVAYTYRSVPMAWESHHNYGEDSVLMEWTRPGMSQGRVVTNDVVMESGDAIQYWTGSTWASLSSWTTTAWVTGDTIRLRTNSDGDGNTAYGFEVVRVEWQ